MPIELYLVSLAAGTIAALVVGFVAGSWWIGGRAAEPSPSFKNSNDTIADLLFPMWTAALRENESFQRGELMLANFTQGFRRTFRVTHRDDPKDPATSESTVPPMFEFVVDLETGELLERSFSAPEIKRVPRLDWSGMHYRYGVLIGLGSRESRIQRFPPRRA